MPWNLEDLAAALGGSFPQWQAAIAACYLVRLEVPEMVP